MTAADDEPRRSRRALVPFLAAAALVLVGGVAVVAATVAAGPPASRPVPLTTAAGFGSPGWNLTGQAVLDSNDPHGTVLGVEVRRDAAAGALPVLTGDFTSDGTRVECRAAAGAWSAGVGDTQVLPVPCDRFVAPAALQRVQAVQVGTAG